VADARDLGNPGTAEFQVEKYPFYLLNRLVSRYNVVIESRLKAIGLDIPYWRVLMILGERQPRSVGQISDAAVINLSTMTRIVQRMVAAGLVKSQPLRADGRVTEVSLTAAGRRKLAEARNATAPVYAEIIEGFSEEQFDGLIESLNRLYQNLG
jgi:DNA-binding MarR family transcriptional regulator